MVEETQVFHVRAHRCPPSKPPPQKNTLAPEVRAAARPRGGYSRGTSCIAQRLPPPTPPVCLPTLGNKGGLILHGRAPAARGCCQTPCPGGRPCPRPYPSPWHEVGGDGNQSRTPRHQLRGLGERTVAPTPPPSPASSPGEPSHRRPHCSRLAFQPSDARPSARSRPSGPRLVAAASPIRVSPHPPTSSPLPPQQQQGSKNQTKKKKTSQLKQFQSPTQEEASGCGAAVSARHTSRASSYLLRERERKKKIPLSHTIIISFPPPLSASNTNFSRQPHAEPPAPPTRGAGAVGEG